MALHQQLQISLLSYFKAFRGFEFLICLSDTTADASARRHAAY